MKLIILDIAKAVSWATLENALYIVSENRFSIQYRGGIWYLVGSTEFSSTNAVHLNILW